MANVSKIKKIEFNLLSSEDIKHDSIIQITDMESYSKNEPNSGGIFDKKMGGINKHELCTTDNLPSNKSPGYFGYIDLALPVYNFHHMDTTIKILSVICIHCSKLIVKTDLVHMSQKNKLGYLFNQYKNFPPRHVFVCKHCSLIQPTKYSFDKKGIDSASSVIITKNHPISIIYPEYAQRIFSRISQKDIEFLGIKNLENLIINRIPVCPPFCRPTVFMGEDIKSEDHITMKYNELLKDNNITQQLILDKRNDLVERQRSVLHYDVATLFDNEAKGLVGTTNKSGVPHVTFGQRINGKISKEGRIRGNLMSKRVEFSARTVISPDPNLNCNEIGIPKYIAMELTLEEKVTVNNYVYLLQHVKNGPSEYPGSKGIIKSSGIFLSSLNENTTLEIGDIVIRHLRDGDYVLINRQPTLHKMSMMGHKVHILPGSSFRLNVNVTEPYNADFDGDEMNLHCPQSIVAQNEVACIAAVHNQCMSPASNLPGIVFIQDNVLSAYKLSKDEKAFSGRKLMNVLSFSNNFYNGKHIKNTYTGLEAIEYFLPEFTDIKDICKGNILDKKKLIKILKFIWHEHGNKECFKFINSTQSLFREYLLSKSFSLSPKDLDCSKEIIDSIDKNLENLNKELDKKSYEHQLTNKKFKKSLSQKDNFENLVMKEFDTISKITEKTLISNEKSRIMDLINSKSKGKNKNVMQIKGFLGQQLAGGGRITNGFTNRTLPHYEKFSENIFSKGFVARSFNRGLTATEYFFHTAGGRDGLIDQALQTGQSGYLQYQMVKTLEDLIVQQNGIVKDANREIVQFKYGSDGSSSEHVEAQDLKQIMSMNIDELELLYELNNNSQQWNIFLEKPLSLTDDQKTLLQNYYHEILEIRRFLIENSLLNPIHTFNHPVNIQNKIEFCANKFKLSKDFKTDLDPITIIQSYYSMVSDNDTNVLFKFLLFTIASPKELICKYRFNKNAFDYFLNRVIKSYQNSRVERGEPVGITSALSIGEPSTQLVLNSFHAAGSGTSGGLPRIQELMYGLNKPDNASMTIHLLPPHNLVKKNVNHIINEEFLHKNIKDSLVGSSLYSFKHIINKPIMNSYKAFIGSDIDDAKWIIKLQFSNDIQIDKVWIVLNNISEVSNLFIKEQNLIFMPIFEDKKKTPLKTLYNNLIQKIKATKISGIENINNVNVEETEQFYYDTTLHSLNSKKVYKCVTSGTNLDEIFQNPSVDFENTISNNVIDTYEILGIEAARHVLLNELYSVLENVADLDIRHVELLTDRLLQKGYYSTIKIESLEAYNSQPLVRASYMNVVNEFQKAALKGEFDDIQGISPNIMCGQCPPCGTGLVDVKLDEDILMDNLVSEKKSNYLHKELPKITIHKQVKFDFDE